MLELDLDVIKAQTLTMEIPPQEVSAEWVFDQGFAAWVGNNSGRFSIKRPGTERDSRLAYINPVIAVILGWLVLGERITTSTVLGTALILTGVFGVFWKRLGPGNR